MGGQASVTLTAGMKRKERIFVFTDNIAPRTKKTKQKEHKAFLNSPSLDQRQRNIERAWQLKGPTFQCTSWVGPATVSPANASRYLSVRTSTCKALRGVQKRYRLSITILHLGIRARKHSAWAKFCSPGGQEPEKWLVFHLSAFKWDPTY